MPAPFRDDALVLTDGAIETRIIYEFKRPIDDFKAFELLQDEAGRGILRDIYAGYAGVARRHALPIQLGTPTWRASGKWTQRVAEVNRSAVALLRDVEAQSGARVILAGVVGPASDGYAVGEALPAGGAFAYHCEQAEALAGAGVDLLYAPTFPAFSELLGVARALAQTGVPYALAPMLGSDGNMLDGTPLAEVIARIDAAVHPKPLHYMIGCLYPTHARSALQAASKTNPRSVRRVRGLKANASPLSPDRLDRLHHVDATPPAQFARDAWACAREFDLSVLGGCCGTDERDIEAVAASAVIS